MENLPRSWACSPVGRGFAKHAWSSEFSTQQSIKLDMIAHSYTARFKTSLGYLRPCLVGYPDIELPIHPQAKVCTMTLPYLCISFFFSSAFFFHPAENAWVPSTVTPSGRWFLLSQITTRETASEEIFYLESVTYILGLTSPWQEGQEGRQ